jgi:mRNA-degrading endonuclease YafQ of YafQ-DinJ toxin-antitoxin module
MKIVPTGYFNRAIKRLHKNEKLALDEAVKDIISNPEAGDLKVGDIAGIRVYKFKVNNALMLLAYSYVAESDILHLLEYGSHENFYRDLKKSM